MMATKPSALITVIGTLLLFAVSAMSAPVLLEPPGNGIPTLSKNKPLEGINSEMISTLADEHFFVKGQQGLKIKNNPNEKIYNSSYALPDKPFSILCNLSVEKGAIHITTGNIRFVVLPDHTEIYQNGKRIKTYESRTNRGIGVERGYGIENRLESVARIHADGYGPGADVKLLFPVTISVRVMPNTLGTIGPWQWQRGMK